MGAKNWQLGEGTGSLRVLVSFVQVYKEQVLDLLNPSLPDGPGGAMRGLRLRWSVARDFYAENLFVEEAADAGAALALFESGVRHKRMAETRMNAASSRSHCLYSLTVQKLDAAGQNVEAEGKLRSVVTSRHPSIYNKYCTLARVVSIFP